MPRRLATACNVPSCWRLAVPGTGRCEVHQRPRPPRSRDAKLRYRYGDGWQSLRLKVLRDEPYCRMCGALAVAVDHVDGDGHNDDPSNLQPLCLRCHNRKSVTHDRGGWAGRQRREGRLVE